MLTGILSGVASGVGGIVSSIFGNKSQKSANQTNLKIAQMNNDWSERMMDKQNQFDIDMWNRNNEYNSASAQVQRLKDAGLNPALYMGSGAAGSASGSSSVGLPSPSSAQVQPLQYSGISKAIESSIMLASQLAKNSAETNFINTQSDVMRAESKARIAEMEQNTRGKKYDTDFRQLNESVRVAMENEQYLSMVQNRDIRELEKVLMTQTKLLNGIQLTNMDDQMKADIALKLAQKDALTMPEMAKELKFFEQKYGQKISRTDLKSIYDAWLGVHRDIRWRGWLDSGSNVLNSIGNAIGNISSFGRKPANIYSPHNHYTRIYQR